MVPTGKPVLERPLATAAIASVPFAVGAALPLSMTDGGGTVLCPLRAMTGVPCPFCGATRAFVAFTHGEPWMQFNGYWVIVGLAIVIGALVIAAVGAATRGRYPRLRARAAPLRPAVMLGLLAALALPGWIWALANRATIG